LHRPEEEDVAVVAAALPYSPEAIDDLSGEHGRMNRLRGEVRKL
jgi:hypothetical protein